MKRRASAWGSCVVLLAALSCGREEPKPAPPAAPAKPAGLSPQMLTDAVHKVIEADRTTYAKKVVNRLQDEEKIIHASEHWQEDKALPLPAQMLRMGAELVADSNAGFSYALLSQWAINKKNVPATDAEVAGLKAVVDNPDKNYYSEETVGGKKYFTAVYPDKAVAPACINCHNNHKDSPRNDFKIGDVMGGVVVRVPVP